MTPKTYNAYKATSWKAAGALMDHDIFD